jgi:NADH-quinone oxidoreductase subunit M
MVGLTALLGILAVGCSWGEIQKNVGFFHLNLLWSLGGVIGVFLAIDMFLFFFFWEMMLVPIYFLIALWGMRVRMVIRAFTLQLNSSSIRKFQA